MTPSKYSQQVEEVDEREWNSNRHNDIAELISLLKSLPDINQILQYNSPELTSKIEFLNGMEEFVSITLREAYKYSRGKLEQISDMERAWNYIVSSDYPFLAWCCLFIAVFLDAAAFLVGLYMYASPDINESKREEEAGRA